VRVWCVGAGAIGGTVAARLAAAGVAPLVVDADATHVRRLRAPGLRVDGPDRVVCPLDAYTPEEIRTRHEPPCDVLLLAVRSQATEAALRPFVDALAPAGQVVSLQNGLNEERIAALVGAARTVGCVVGFGATWLGPGHVEVTSPGDLAIGRLDGACDPSLEAVRDLLARGVPARITTNVVGALWGKMLVNSVTVLGALGGCLFGELLAEYPQLCARVLAEGVDVASAEGVGLEDVFGLVPAAMIVAREPGWVEHLERAFVAVARVFGQVKSVTWRDLELGRPTEIDAVTGEIVRRAVRAGVAAPVNGAAYAWLRDVEAGRRPIARANLDALWARAREDAS
jgi:2-dehydropantoate 2-reductase